ncbi:MAG TPA: choice-of-anchor Q domain-containing protein [Bryobacteraceae bacterium]|nr:choice-of-anchor Q domain-containing protein [Bryobacteraceae bacterium]
MSTINLYERADLRISTLLLLSGLTVFGATITVTNVNDSGGGSLRAAMTNAAAGDTINFQAGLKGTITLAAPLPVINQNLTISGPGASVLAISGNNQVRVLHIVFPGGLNISGVTIENGIAPGSPLGDGFGGGGVLNLGGLNMTDCALLNNAAFRGGGIESQGGLQILNSTLAGNSSTSDGGGIWSGGNGLTPILVMINSTLAGNSANARGGAIFNGFSGVGGASSSVSVAYSTLSGNSAAGGSSGVQNSQFNGPGSFSIVATLLAHHGNGSNCGVGLIQSGGYNLSDDASCNLFATGDISNAPAGLDPAGLKENGGPTQTIALEATSPAVNAITGPLCTNLQGLAFDQRGVPRPQGPGCDIGAFELATAVNLSAAIVNKGPLSAGVRFYDLQITNHGPGDAAGISITQLPLSRLGGTGTVTNMTSLPINVGSLAAGASTTVRLTLGVPATVTRLRIGENGTFQNGANQTASFSLLQAVFP